VRAPGLANGGRGAKGAKGVNVGRWCPPHHWGEVSAEGAMPSSQKKSILDLKWRILVQLGAFCTVYLKLILYTILVRRRPKCQTLAICMPMNKPAPERQRQRSLICPESTE